MQAGHDVARHLAETNEYRTLDARMIGQLRAFLAVGQQRQRVNQGVERNV